MENPFELINNRLDVIEKLISEIKLELYKEKNIEPVESQFMNVKQVAAYLSLSIQTIYTFTHKREIPFSKIRKRLYFNKFEIDAWVSLNRKNTISEIDEEVYDYLANLKRKDNRR